MSQETVHETLHMSVSGDFITNMARTWFWDEHRPLNLSLDLLKTCIQDVSEEEAQAISISILEGRKKFVGINQFELVDDNEHVRTMTDYIMGLEKQKTIQAIIIDMQGNFFKYVDIYSTIKSSHSSCIIGINTFQECRQWFTMERNQYSGSYDEIYIDYYKKNLIDLPTMGGLWLINEPETVYEACKGEMNLIGKPEFWHRIYEIKKDDPDFKDRNERYLCSIRPKPSFEERMHALLSTYNKEHPKDSEETPEYLTDAWFAYQYKHTKEKMYCMEPDDIDCWEGLIAPNGDFYSCDFGGHNAKAYYLLVRHPEWINSTKEDIMNSVSIRMDNSLDILLEQGWCATRSVMYEHYLMPPLPQKPTKHQLNRIFDAIIKHDIHIPTEELFSYY